MIKHKATVVDYYILQLYIHNLTLLGLSSEINIRPRICFNLTHLCLSKNFFIKYDSLYMQLRPYSSIQNHAHSDRRAHAAMLE